MWKLRCRGECRLIGRYQDPVVVLWQHHDEEGFWVTCPGRLGAKPYQVPQGPYRSFGDQVEYWRDLLASHKVPDRGAVMPDRVSPVAAVCCSCRRTRLLESPMMINPVAWPILGPEFATAALESPMYGATMSDGGAIGKVAHRLMERYIYASSMADLDVACAGGPVQTPVLISQTLAGRPFRVCQRCGEAEPGVYPRKRKVKGRGVKESVV